MATHFELSGAYRRTEEGNISFYYGNGGVGWPSKEAAYTIPQSIRKGLTIGVIENEKIVEYIWHPEDLSDEGLVIKTAGADPEGYAILEGDNDYLGNQNVEGNINVKGTLRLQPVNGSPGVNINVTASQLRVIPENPGQTMYIQMPAIFLGNLDVNGQMNLSSTPTSYTHATNKGYVDNAVVNKQDKLMSAGFGLGRFADVPGAAIRVNQGTEVSWTPVTGPFYIKITSPAVGGAPMQLKGNIFKWGPYNSNLDFFNFRVFMYPWISAGVNRNWAHSTAFVDGYTGNSFANLPISFGNEGGPNGAHVIRIGNDTTNWGGFQIDVMLNEVEIHNQVVGVNHQTGWQVVRSLSQPFVSVVDTTFQKTNVGAVDLPQVPDDNDFPDYSPGGGGI